MAYVYCLGENILNLGSWCVRLSAGVVLAMYTYQWPGCSSQYKKDLYGIAVI